VLEKSTNHVEICYHTNYDNSRGEIRHTELDTTADPCHAMSRAACE